MENDVVGIPDQVTSSSSPEASQAEPKEVADMRKEVSSIHSLLTAAFSYKVDVDVQFNDLLKKLKNRKLAALAYVAADVNFIDPTIPQERLKKRTGKHGYGMNLLAWVSIFVIWHLPTLIYSYSGERSL